MNTTTNNDDEIEIIETTKFIKQQHIDEEGKKAAEAEEQQQQQLDVESEKSWVHEGKKGLRQDLRTIILLIYLYFLQGLPLGLAAATAILFVTFIWYTTHKKAISSDAMKITNPFKLSQAIKFAILLTIILLLERVLTVHFGAGGLYALAAIAGLADLDAITLSVAKNTNAGGEVVGGVVAILLAMSANVLVKSVIAAMRAGGAFSRWSISAMVGMLLAAVCGLTINLSL